MKKLFLLLFCFSAFQTSYSQVKEYFIPSEKYFSQEFIFESSWTNENGFIENKNIVRYSLDPTGNYKQFIIQESTINNVPQSYSDRVHKFFFISDNSVAEIYSYTEGVSEELKSLGYNVDKQYNKIILKNARSEWQDNTDKDVTIHYSSESGNLKTKYASYDNCIIVTEVSKANSAEFKWAEMTTKYYYANNVGLVKTEYYKDGELLDMNFGYGGVLVDNFSEYSYQRE